MSPCHLRIEVPTSAISGEQSEQHDLGAVLFEPARDLERHHAA
jgi:hypothetical protein